MSFFVLSQVTGTETIHLNSYFIDMSDKGMIHDFFLFRRSVNLRFIRFEILVVVTCMYMEWLEEFPEEKMKGE